MIENIHFSGIASGIKKNGIDLGLVYFREAVNVYAVYTRNRVKAAHILYNLKKTRNPIKAILVNSGCANACTGETGVDDLRLIGQELSSLLDAKPGHTLFASTGVIGKKLPVDTIIASLPELVRNLDKSGINLFSRAIMTTDTFPKTASVRFRGDKEYTVEGVAKGAGMINPLFATMLAFVFTDYPLSPSTARMLLRKTAQESFEKITVDGECSTNDTIMLCAPGGNNNPDSLSSFGTAFSEVMTELSRMVVRDGEGATRVIHIVVKGAKTKRAAEKVARRIATSPLTKTAFFGCDPNWGRIICAAGDAGIPIQQAMVEIIMEGKTLVKNGLEVPFDESQMKTYMDKKELEVVVDLHEGDGLFDIYTTDLTYDYVKINASYRT